MKSPKAIHLNTSPKNVMIIKMRISEVLQATQSANTLDTCKGKNSLKPFSTALINSFAI